MNPFNPHNNSENIYDFYFTHDETEIQRHCITRLRLQILSGKGRFQAHLADFQYALCELSTAATTNYHKHDGLKQEKFSHSSGDQKYESVGSTRLSPKTDPSLPLELLVAPHVPWLAFPPSPSVRTLITAFSATLNPG